MRCIYLLIMALFFSFNVSAAERSKLNCMNSKVLVSVSQVKPVKMEEGKQYLFVIKSYSRLSRKLIAINYGMAEMNDVHLHIVDGPGAEGVLFSTYLDELDSSELRLNNQTIDLNCKYISGF